MIEQNGLLCAVILDGQGGGREIGWPEIRAWKEEQGVLWVHLDFKGDEARRWLEGESGVDPIICQTMLQEDVRPRHLPLADALLVVLRGVNLNAGADPEDMVDVRIWLDGKRIITMRHRRLMAVNDIREALAAGTGPKGPGSFLASLAFRLIDRIGPVIEGLEDRIDTLESHILEGQSADLRAQLAHLRRECILLRRYLAPQREVLSRLAMSQLSWLDERHKAELREVADRTIRHLEELEAARERAAVTQEELNNRLADQMNKTMYVLTVVAAVLLPPSLITGLFGINVGGMPGVESKIGFLIVGVLIIVVAILEVIIFRRLKWI